MKLVHADEVEWKRGLQHRGGTFHYRHLLEGEAGSPGNFHLGIGQQDGDFASPRHRHNFDQFRFQLEGTSNFDRNGKMTAGTFGYFPEGAAYGPQSSEGRSVTAVLQFGGASGSGYLSPKEVTAATEELKKFGTFEGGIFRRNDDSEGRRNSDAYQAIWEHVNGRRMDYPKPRYRDPIMVDPENYEWLPLAGHRGVSLHDRSVLSLNANARPRSSGSCVGQAIEPALAASIWCCPARALSARSPIDQ